MFKQIIPIALERMRQTPRYLTGLRPELIALYLVVFFLLFAFFWASMSSLDEVTRGTGKIIPSSEVRIIQHLEGGVVAGISVRAGDFVQQGDELIVLEQSKQIVSVEDARAELRTVLIEIARHESLLNGVDLIIPEDLIRSIDLTAHNSAYLTEKARHEAELSAAGAEYAQVDSELEGARRGLVLLRQELQLSRSSLAMARELDSTGAISAYELMKEEREALAAEREVQVFKSRIEELQQNLKRAKSRQGEVQEKFKADRWARLSELYPRRDAIRAQLSSANDGLLRTVVRAPVSGTVKQVFVNVLGGVIQPGAPLVELVPIEDDLLVEAKIRPQDIGFINVGQKAVVKVTAYDYAMYGSLHGEVDHISADSILEKDEEFYHINVRLKDGYKHAELVLKPGMTISVDILTGKKTVLDYLLKPVLRGLSTSLTER